MKYAVLFEQVPGNWRAYAPDLPGCIATGPTLEDTRRPIVEGIQFHVEGLQRRSSGSGTQRGCGHGGSCGMNR
jgi:predicted RNase H-like HicB family nuclease